METVIMNSSDFDHDDVIASNEASGKDHIISFRSSLDNGAPQNNCVECFDSEPPLRMVPVPTNVETNRWMADASASLIKSLLNHQGSSLVSSMWLPVLKADIPQEVETHRQRAIGAEAALRSNMNRLTKEESEAVAREQDFIINRANEAGAKSRRIAEECSRAIDAAVENANHVRRTYVQTRKELDEMKQKLKKMCLPYSKSPWGKRIGEIVADEAKCAHGRLKVDSQRQVDDIRRCSLQAEDQQSVPFVSNPHLNTLGDAVLKQHELAAIESMIPSLLRCRPVIHSCEGCRGPNSACITES